jgi:hypothetical protein
LTREQSKTAKAMAYFAYVCVVLLCFHAVAGIPITAKPGRISHGEPITWGDINIFHLTDVHSWLSGHQHEESIQADIADVVSFYHHLKHKAASAGKDLWFFDRYVYSNSQFFHLPNPKIQDTNR